MSYQLRYFNIWGTNEFSIRCWPSYALYLSLKKAFIIKVRILYLSCWSNGQSGWLHEVKGSGFEFEFLWSQKIFPNLFLGKMFEKHSKLNLKIR
jgi:hypothetical protein